MMMNFIKITALSMLMATPLLADSSDAKWCVSDDGINFLKTYQRGTDDVTMIKWRDNVRLLEASDRQKVESQIINNADKFSPSGRAVAAYALGCIGSDASVPLLGKWAQDKDAGADAIRALIMLHSPAALQQLNSLLPAATLDAKITILDGLASKSDSSAVKFAAGLLNGGDPKLTESGLVYLGTIGSDDAIAAINGFKPDSPKFTLVKNWALVNAAQHAVQDGRNSQASAVFKKLLNTESEPIRIAAAQGLLQSDGVPALKETLFPLLQGKDESLRRKLARVLVAYPVPEPKTSIGKGVLPKLSSPSSVVDALAQSFGSFPDDVQLVLVKNINNLQLGSNFLPVVKVALKAKSTDVQAVAIESLGSSGDQASFEILANALKDQNLSDAAISALSHLQGKDLHQMIAKSASSADDTTKPKWLAIIAARANHDNLPLVVESAKSSNQEVRSAAFAALKNVMSAEDLSALVDLYPSAASNADKKFWREALVKVSRSRAGDSKAVELLQPLLDKATDNELQAIVAAVASVDNSKAADVLGAQLKGPDVDRRKDIIRALSNVRNKTALGLLEDSATNGKDPTEKILALRGLLDTVRQMDLNDDEKVKIWARAWDLASRQEEKDAIISAVKDRKGNKNARELLQKIGG